MATSKVIRAWAREQGKNVGERGRLHPTIVADYYKAIVDGPEPEVHVVTDEDEGSGEDEDPHKGYGRLLEDGAGVGSSPCGFCGTKTCLLCPRTVRNGVDAKVKIWVCPCAFENHWE